jgi:predicted RNA-binding protein with PUA-like domain
VAYWILKTDADSYPFEQLTRERRTVWDGVTNALALKHIRSMAQGDNALIYHSNVGKELVGLARIASAPHPDPARNDPKLSVVDIEADRSLPRPVTLSQIKADPAFADLALVRMPRLSVIPVPAEQWKKLLTMGGLRAD